MPRLHCSTTAPSRPAAETASRQHAAVRTVGVPPLPRNPGCRCPSGVDLLLGTMRVMSNLMMGDRSATSAEVLAARGVLRQLAERHGLVEPRVDAAGTVVVHSDDPGYGPLQRYALAAATTTGVWVNVITDDAPAAQVETEAL